MDAPTTAQTTYYVIATIGVLVATVINLILVNRNKPDKIKAAVNAAVLPLSERLEEVENAQEAQHEQLNEQDVTLAQIKTELQYAPNKSDLATLHHRITDLVRSSTENTAMNRVLQNQVSQLSQFLMERGRD